MLVELDSSEVVEACAFWLKSRHGLVVAEPQKNHSCDGRRRGDLQERVYRMDAIRLTFSGVAGEGYRTNEG
jgi:hypothetical protein